MKRGLSEKQEIMRGKTNIFLKPFMKQILLLFFLLSSTISLLTLKKIKLPLALTFSSISLHPQPCFPAIHGGPTPETHMQLWIQLQVILLFISIPILPLFLARLRGIRIRVLRFRLPYCLKHKLSFDSSCMWVDLKFTKRFS